MTKKIEGGNLIDTQLIEEYTSIIRRKKRLLNNSGNSKEKIKDYENFLLQNINEERLFLEAKGGKLLEKEKILLKSLNRREKLLTIFGNNITFR